MLDIHRRLAGERHTGLRKFSWAGTGTGEQVGESRLNCNCFYVTATSTRPRLSADNVGSFEEIATDSSWELGEIRAGYGREMFSAISFGDPEMRRILEVGWL